MKLIAYVVLFSLAGCATVPESVPGHAERHHHLRFQNGYVRVMETRLEANEETLPHSHPVDAAVVFLTPGVMRITYDDGTKSESMIEANTVAFGASPIVHRAANVGDETVRVLVTEIFTTPPAQDPPQSLPSAGDVLLENDVVRMSRMTIASGDSATLADAPPLVVVAISEGTVESNGKASKLRRGDAIWCDTDLLTLRSFDRAAFEAIFVMLKPRESLEE